MITKIQSQGGYHPLPPPYGGRRWSKSGSDWCCYTRPARKNEIEAWEDNRTRLPTRTGSFSTVPPWIRRFTGELHRPYVFLSRPLSISRLFLCVTAINAFSPLPLISLPLECWLRLPLVSDSLLGGGSNYSGGHLFSIRVRFLLLAIPLDTKKRTGLTPATTYYAHIHYFRELAKLVPPYFHIFRFKFHKIRSSPYNLIFISFWLFAHNIIYFKIKYYYFYHSMDNI